MHVLSSVNREFRFDRCIHISALQEEDKIYMKEKARECHEQVEASINHCVNHEKLELF
jgi:hypothetical protein